MKMARHVTLMGEIENAYKTSWQTWIKEHSEDLGIGDRITLKCDLKKQGRKQWAGCTDSGFFPVVTNVSTGYIESGECPNYWANDYRLKKYSAPYNSSDSFNNNDKNV